MRVIDLKATVNQVIPNNLSSEVFPFAPDYYESAQRYDLLFWQHYGLKELIPEFGIETADDWNNAVLSVLYTYKEQLKNFWNINIAEYSPIDNVFEETTQNTHRRKHEETFTSGAQTNSETLGSRTDTQNVGSNGKTGNSTTTTTSRRVPYDMSTEKEVGSDTSAVVNSELESTQTSGQQVNSATVGQRVDKTESSPQHEKVTINRHGNIGTTLSTDVMLGSENYWKHFNFMNELFSLINQELCRGEWF